MKQAYIAVDFGAGSGRVIAGTFGHDGELELHEIHRFQNRQVRLGESLYWDFPALFADMTEGLRKAAKEFHIASIGIDTWGVDFGLIDKHGHLIGNPICYRDAATEGLPEQTFPGEEMNAHYAEAGIQVMAINTLYRLLSVKATMPDFLSIADKLLFMPDLFSYFLTGVANNEYTIASTSELLDAKSRDWNHRLIEHLGLPKHIFCPIVMPGTKRGMLTERVKAQIGIGYDVPVIAVGSHDTASAASIVEGCEKRMAFLSSGTWSLLGAVIDEPILTEEARKAGFSNEGAVGGKIKFLQNITGLWILQRLVDQWQKEGLCTEYPYMIAEAEKADIDSIIDVDDPAFTAPADMQKAIADYCSAHSLKVPETQGEVVRVALQSLAHRYGKAIEGLNRLLPAPVEAIRIFGGGSRNGLLNRLTAEATGLEVVAGPVEATAIGNIMCQANAL